MGLTREDIIEGRIEARILEADRDGLIGRTPPEERRASRDAILAQLPPGADVWVFGYGSLMWNPCIHAAECRPGLVHGYHRSFCFWSPVGRGTPDNPGLMLGLEPRGSCRGIAYRIPHADIDVELEVVWNREMITGVYLPRLLRVATPQGPVTAVAFVVNRAHPRYAGGTTEERVIEALATARGELGSAADYLFSTVAHLDSLDIADGPMHRLARRVAERMKRNSTK